MHIYKTVLVPIFCLTTTFWLSYAAKVELIPKEVKVNIEDLGKSVEQLTKAIKHFEFKIASQDAKDLAKALGKSLETVAKELKDANINLTSQDLQKAAANIGFEPETRKTVNEFPQSITQSTANITNAFKTLGQDITTSVTILNNSTNKLCTTIDQATIQLDNILENSLRNGGVLVGSLMFIGTGLHQTTKNDTTRGSAVITVGILLWIANEVYNKKICKSVITNNKKVKPIQELSNPKKLL